ncbi:MAG: hypothetical protein ACREJC_20600 [Tepidisphaeraceae bacterium]
MMEPLEQRQLMSASMCVTNTISDGLPGGGPTPQPKPIPDLNVSLNRTGSLRITGSNFNDHIIVKIEKGKLHVKANRVDHFFRLSAVKRILADLGRGHDDFDTLGTVRIRMELNGGAGNDQLTGGAKDDRIDGGAGFDFIEGGVGRDVLIGGKDRDHIYTENPLVDQVIAEKDDWVHVGAVDR